MPIPKYIKNVPYETLSRVRQGVAGLTADLSSGNVSRGKALDRSSLMREGVQRAKKRGIASLNRRTVKSAAKKVMGY